MSFLPSLCGSSNTPAVRPEAARAGLGLEVLEDRCLLSISATLTDGLLTILGSPQRDSIRVFLDPSKNELVVQNFGVEAGRFAAPAVTAISIDGGGGADTIKVDPSVLVPAQIVGGPHSSLFGGSGRTLLQGVGTGNKLVTGNGPTTLDSGGGDGRLLGVKSVDTVIPRPGDRVTLALVPPPVVNSPTTILDTGDVETLLERAAAASSSTDAIIAVVDRGGNPLGVRVEDNVSPTLISTAAGLSFAVDGALAEARTAAFFANNSAPLTSRTVQFISQTTVTQREVDSNPNIADPNSTQRGPGFVAPVGIKGHFPPNVPFTPQVDLFNIEASNRVQLPFSPANVLSYGAITGIFPTGQGRGIGTLPGGIPIFKNGVLVGGIGVFFPGQTGFATEENSALSTTADFKARDRSLEAEYMAFAAVGGDPGAGAAVGNLGGVDPVQGISLPNGRIDLVGITLDIFGPGGLNGPGNLLAFGSTLGQGRPDDGHDIPVTPAGATLKDGTSVPEGWLVTPRDGVGITAAQVQQIISQGIAEAEQTRAAIRLPLGQRTRMVFAVADKQGTIVGLYRMPDATVFSIDVAVAKARNVAYLNDPGQVQPEDLPPGITAGTAFTARSIRYLALPRFPEGIDGQPPGPYSILNDGGVDPNTGLNVGRPLPASAYQSVQGYDAFNPGTNFRQPPNGNQNGIIFFPGSSGVYVNGRLIGGFGVSGDGVDQDDVVTAAGISGFEPPPQIDIDHYFVNGVRVPYMKFNRNPLA